MTPAKIKFLIALGSAIRNGAVKTIKQAMNFAEQQFGKIDKSFVDDIVNVFKKEGKIKKKGEVVPIKKKIPIRKDQIDDIESAIKADEGIMAADAAKEIVKKRTKDIAKGDPTGEVGEGVESLETSIKKIKETAEELKKSTLTPESIFKDFVQGQSKMRDLRREGQVRTAVRWFMKQEMDAGRLKLKDIDKEALEVYGQTKTSDPIEIFRRYYGEDALEAADDVADVFNQGENFNHYGQLLRENVDSKILTPKTKGLGDYDQSVIDAERTVKEAEKDAKNLETLEKFDPTNRTKNADGGLINILKL